MKILFLDIETSPNIVHTWGLFNQFVALNQIVKSGQTICWAARWMGQKTVMYSGHDTDSHKNMLKKIHTLLSEADAVVTYNGNRFDLPTLNKEFIKAGMKPPAPYKKIDLLTVARSQFKFTSNKLDYVAQFLGLGAKEKHKGHNLWVDCMANDPKAWKVMQRYNKQDVVLLEKVYETMLPWIPRHANWSVFSDKFCCPNCGSTHFQSRGDRYYKSLMGVYNRYQCNKCGTWFKDNKNQARGYYESVAGEFMTERIRVTTLKRVGPPQNGGWFYYTPDGHAIGPFDYESEMEEDIELHYKEVKRGIPSR